VSPLVRWRVSSEAAVLELGPLFVSDSGVICLGDRSDLTGSVELTVDGLSRLSTPELTRPWSSVGGLQLRTTQLRSKRGRVLYWARTIAAAFGGITNGLSPDAYSNALFVYGPSVYDEPEKCLLPYVRRRKSYLENAIAKEFIRRIGDHEAPSSVLASAPEVMKSLVRGYRMRRWRGTVIVEVCDWYAKSIVEDSIKALTST